jgi:hypothetical protein
MSKSELRGHPIYFDGEVWCYKDSGEPTVDTHKERPCGSCGEHATAEGHDHCLGTLPGVMNACCGHGVMGDAYVQFWDGSRLSSWVARVWLKTAVWLYR